MVNITPDSIFNIRWSLMRQPGAAVARTPSFLCELYPGLAVLTYSPLTI